MLRYQMRRCQLRQLQLHPHHRRHHHHPAPGQLRLEPSQTPEQKERFWISTCSLQGFYPPSIATAELQGCSNVSARPHEGTRFTALLESMPSIRDQRASPFAQWAKSLIG